MDDQTARDLLKRVKTLENEVVRLRRGVVTDGSPLSVALGGSDVAYEDVRALDGPLLDTGDPVAVLLRGNDLLVLGALAGRPFAVGTTTVTYGAAATVSNEATVTHGLGVVPVYVHVTADYVNANHNTIAVAGCNVDTGWPSTTQFRFRTRAFAAPGAGIYGVRWLAMA